VFSFVSNPATLFTGTMYIIQRDNNTLSGLFQFSDGSGSEKFLGSSKINGNEVTIEWMVDVYTISFRGIVDSAYYSMNGMFYRIDLPDPFGSWSALKVSNKRDLIIKNGSGISEKERFLKYEELTINRLR